MISKISILLQIVFSVAIFAEPPSNQNQGYPSSGWRPAGPAFKLPERQYLPQVDLSYGIPQKTSTNNNGNIEQAEPNVEYGVPETSIRYKGFGNYVDLTYNAPQDTLSVPPNQPAVTYGPPQEETTTVLPSTTEVEITTTESPTTTEENENPEEGSGYIAQKDNYKDDSENSQQGIYYIYHPSGLLQRVAYSTKDDLANMAYSAQLKYENVEPIRGPVYTYDPVTFSFSKLYK
ncbi:unnamed protein product [Ceutorhynchus assimilis]|uniref:DUF4794 domain-containing protein n=1 Tax=Ceutorhynchus assimilis TaxID=467358 RepID=A0A9N9MU62_9CUCU|nr:unnamed protein product [Ceutorhynchus assimilis]